MEIIRLLLNSYILASVLTLGSEFRTEFRTSQSQRVGVPSLYTHSLGRPGGSWIFVIRDPPTSWTCNLAQVNISYVREYSWSAICVLVNILFATVQRNPAASRRTALTKTWCARGRMASASQTFDTVDHSFSQCDVPLTGCLQTYWGKVWPHPPRIL